MKNLVVGYVATIAGALVGLITLASFGAAQPNFLVSGVLAMLAMALLAAGWYGLRHETPHSSLDS